MNWARTAMAWLTTKSDEPRLTRKQKYIEEYLSKSTDRVDLERRERELSQKGFYTW